MKLGEEVTEQDIDCIMKLADTDGDGTIDISVTVDPPTPDYCYLSLHLCLL